MSNAKTGDYLPAVTSAGFPAQVTNIGITSWPNPWHPDTDTYPYP